MLPRYTGKNIDPQPLLQHKLRLLGVPSENVQPYPTQTEPGCCMTLPALGWAI